MLRSLICSLLIGNIAYGIENSIKDECNAAACLHQYESKFSDTQRLEILKSLSVPCHLRVMTYNVLSKDYDSMQLEQNRWLHRKDRLIEVIKHDAPDLFCCQELTIDQIEDLEKAFGHSFQVYAPLPEQFRTEMLGIFYNKDRFEFIDGEKKELGAVYFWEQFQTMCFQYFIKASFVDKSSGKGFTVYNTHLDYLKPNVRQQLLDLLLKNAEKEAEERPVIVAGDFNTLPSQLPDTYKVPTTPGLDGAYLLQTLTKKHFRNTLDLALIAHVGPMSSFTYSTKNQSCFCYPDTMGLILDHIFVTPDRIKVLFHAIDPATVDGHFPSDHLPVFADLAIP